MCFKLSKITLSDGSPAVIIQLLQVEFKSDKMTSSTLIIRWQPGKLLNRQMVVLSKKRVDF